jgi:hypothetical protein
MGCLTYILIGLATVVLAWGLFLILVPVVLFLLPLLLFFLKVTVILLVLYLIGALVMALAARARGR